MKVGTLGEAAAGARGAETGRPHGRRVLIFMRPGHVDAGLVGLVGAMLERDHEVVVALDGHGTLARADQRSLADLAERHAELDQLRVPPRGGVWRIPAGAIRRALDYLRCLEEEPADAREPCEEARERAPRLLRALLVLPPFRWGFGRRMLAWLLRHFEAGLPIRRETRALIRDRSPDVVVVSRGAELGSPEAELVRSAQAARTPSVLVMNGMSGNDPARVRDIPTLVVAVDQEQANALVEGHGLPRDRIQTVGGETVAGVEIPAPAAVVDALGEAERAEASGPRGRFLRPLLWLLTPLLVLLLPLLRPRATITAVRKRRRVARKRAAAARKRRDRERAASEKARGRAAKQEKRARSEASKQAKQEKRARSEASKQAKQEGRARSGASKEGKQGKQARSEASKEGKQARSEEGKQRKLARAEEKQRKRERRTQ